MPRVILLISFLFSVTIYCQNSNDSDIIVKGKIWFAESYCKGVPPEIIDEGSTYAGVTLYIIKKSSQPFDSDTILSFTSNEQGGFEFRLPKGIYSIIGQPYYNQTSGIIWTQGPEYELKVGGYSNFIQLGFYKACPDGPERM